MLELKIGQAAGMDAFALAASIVQTLAWPVALVVIVLLVRDRMGDALKRILEISFPGGSLKFGEKLEELKAASEEVIAAQPESFAGPGARDEGAPQFASGRVLSTREAVWVSFLQVEDEVRKAAGVLGNVALSKPLFAVVQELARRGVVNSAMSDLYGELSKLRNQVAHARKADITEKQAEEYARQCGIFVTALRANVEAYKSRGG